MKPLSPRETEVARLISEGYRNHEIAKKLGIAEPTVGVHVQNAFEKLAIHNRTQLAVWFVQNSEVPA